MSDDVRINTSGNPRGPNAPLRRGPAPLRDFLRIAGPAVAAIGLVFLLIGLGDFFMAFGTFRPPRYFWCAFLGMPLLAGGVALTRFAYLGPLARYVAEETAPVGKDVINYMARGTEPVSVFLHTGNTLWDTSAGDAAIVSCRSKDIMSAAWLWENPTTCDIRRGSVGRFWR